MSTPMPTGAKLMAAVCFAVVGWIMANYFLLNVPEVSSIGPLRVGSAVVGAIVGWSVMGNSAGTGYVEAAGAGVRTAIILAVVALFLLGLGEMLKSSVRMQYDGALDAILDIFRLMGKRSAGFLSLGVFGTLLLGGIVGGLLTENAGRRWK